MENIIPQSLALALFYGAGILQILLVSVYVPHHVASRLRYVFETYPAESYPKLYPFDMATTDTRTRLRGLALYQALNALIAAMGFALLIWLFLSDYRLANEGGDEIFVMLFFFLQISPQLYVALREAKHLEMLRKAYDNSQRRADLQPRRLVDFVSPWVILLAVVMFVLWLVFYLSGRNPDTQPLSEIIATISGMSIMNICFAISMWRALHGIGQNPYMGSDDKRKMAGAICKTLPVVSITASAFLMLTHAADSYALEIIDPVITSIYMQICVAIGFGIAFFGVKVDSIDFEPYRDSSSSA